MKGFLILAIVAFTACQAKEPINALLDPIAKALRPAEDVLKRIRETHLGQEVGATVTEMSKVAIEYVEPLWKKLNPLAKDIITKITKEAEVLRGRLEHDLIAVRDKLEPYAENLKRQIQQRVEDLRVAVAPYDAVVQKTEELRESLEEKVKELQSQLEPYTEELRQKADQHVQEFQKTVAPLTEKLQTKIAERAALVQQGLAPYAEDLKEKLDPYVQNLNNRLSVLYEAYTNTD